MGIKTMKMSNSIVVPALVFLFSSVASVDCSSVSVSVKQEGRYYYATAKDGNGNVCGRGESANKNQAIALAKQECDC